jgi:hypothetical protein
MNWRVDRPSPLYLATGAQWVRPQIPLFDPTLSNLGSNIITVIITVNGRSSDSYQSYQSSATYRKAIGFPAMRLVNIATKKSRSIRRIEK